MKKWLAALAVVIGFFVIGAVCFLAGMQNGDTSIITVERYVPGLKEKRERSQILQFTGYVRGIGRTTLKNKYAGFVSKVRVYSHHHVKKGDVILEYDDLTWRTAMEKLKNSIAEQEKILLRKKLNLILTKLDPLPSEYRNLYWKRKIAQDNLERSSHAFNVYRRLHNSKIVTDLVFREKQEAFLNSQAEVRKIDNDMKILKKGLADFYIKSAESEVSEAETKLKALESELSLLKEEGKYYKIRAPYDGYCITNSDTVHGYNPAGTAAAEVHRVDKKLVYSYCPERYLHYVREGEVYQFVSNQYPDDRQGFEMKCLEIKQDRYQYGDESYFFVKFSVEKEPYPLRIGSVGKLEIPLIKSKRSSK